MKRNDVSASSSSHSHSQTTHHARTRFHHRRRRAPENDQRARGFVRVRALARRPRGVVDVDVVGAHGTSDADRDIAAAASTSAHGGRRGALVALGALALAMTTDAPRAEASSDRPFKEVCDPTADGADCRARILAQDAVSADTYDSKKSTFKAANASTNPNLTTYQSDTLAFLEEVEALLAKDVYDPTREKAIAVFQKKSNDWSGKYAPGGSSKMASGRAFYNALNQLAGHFSFNGLAPLPKSRLEVVETNIAKTRELIAEGR